MSSGLQPTKTLIDAKKSADLYLEEAKLCATCIPRVLGFAAMSLTLACVVSIGEALTGKARDSDENCITAFCGKLVTCDWLLSHQGQVSNQSPAQILSRVRNALVHALSLPNDVCLVPTPEAFYSAYSPQYSVGIVPSLFVGAVQRTIDDIVQQQPLLTFDRLSSQQSRSPVSI
jgi:hypothetical protein